MTSVVGPSPTTVGVKRSLFELDLDGLGEALPHGGQRVGCAYRATPQKRNRLSEGGADLPLAGCGAAEVLVGNGGGQTLQRPHYADAASGPVVQQSTAAGSIRMTGVVRGGEQTRSTGTGS